MDAILEFKRIEASTQGVACEVIVSVHGTELLQRTLYVSVADAAKLDSKDAAKSAALLKTLFNDTIESDLAWHAEQVQRLAEAATALPAVKAVVQDKVLDMERVTLGVKA